jgi:hypothetical protein
MKPHILTVEAALDALDRHSRSRIPRVSLQPGMPAPPNVIHMPPPPYDVDLPRSEYFRLGDVQGRA